MSTIVSTLPKFDHVGSFLRPQRIKDARKQHAEGSITTDELTKIENEEITNLVAKQKEVGLKTITDGEFRRGWWHFDYLAGLEGIEVVETERGVPFHDVETSAFNIRINGKIKFNNHYMLEHFRFLKEVVGNEGHIAKMIIPSPNMIFFREGIGSDFEKQFYSSLEEIYVDLIQAYKDAVTAFYNEGCRYLQLDDTAWALFFDESSRNLVRAFGSDPDELIHQFKHAVNEVTSVKPDDMVMTMHICRGNYKSSYASSGSYDGASEIIFGQLNLDGLFLEFDDSRSGGFEPLRHIKRSDLHVVLGLITTKTPSLEDADAIKARINEAAQYVSLDQLHLSPQCGFASTEEGNLLTEEEQWAKVRHVIDIANSAWK
ncbi:5-methyltetrahydropteroyltriglutamate--homocysteine S-methyltransferase [Metabacillus endolithicus]|uniref:5-methyltetrahydropteroyltriglutamate--homocysteine S-methyltransferase n=1 Tax=Metabacillus endolithicus TaxID=1535204 RepID=A0ABW5BT78_9BACI|nr:5-methyltetrahydropteroyltriglutamate--homocysteine S-methyltransferase [Metabacillus endolithicus]UPG62873.1 5-methyltetrahydropteroyltriglutamate--homocysteine S-methyltransferase [Metabacillus endolithicus]